MEQGIYTQITPQEAKRRMDEQESFVLLDVRSQEEFDEEHLEGAILIPEEDIQDRAGEELGDQATPILVYCRSGRRSKQAAQTLADLGYTKVYEFGGILDWPYETVKK